MKKKTHLKRKYKILLTIVLTLTLTVLWSRYISTAGLEVKEYKIINSDLPSSFDGLKIVHFTDVHYGRTIKNKELTRLVNEINELKPDLIFFTGDLIDKDTRMTKQIKNDVGNILSGLKASIGKYAISGNHDMKFKDYDSIIKAAGFINLDSSYDIIYSKAYEPIYIAGLESEISGKPDTAKALSYLDNNGEDQTNKVIPKYRILLLHTPDTYEKVKSYNFDLVVAGHSHNGQIRLPFVGALFTPSGAKKYYDPHYKIGKTDLFVSGGLGTSNANYRLFNKPAFNFYRLVQK